MKRIVSLILVLVTLATLLTGCMGETSKPREGRVYFLNFKPEQDAAWQRLAKKYTNDTGVEVKVVTAASGTYEQTLISEIDKDDPPTLFQVNGPVGLKSWKDYCLDLTNTDIVKELVSDDFTLKDDGKIYAVAYVYEAYGLITNKKLLKEAGYNIEDITSFKKLKEVAEDITARKDKLGFSAFTSSGLGSASSWRFSGHLANLPLFYEFEEDGVNGQPASVKGTYLDEFKAIWDLYINNSTIDKNTITSDQNDAAAEFKAGKAVFYQNGTWEYDNIKSIGKENIGFLPIYFGVDDEKQGLCSGTENFWAVNSEASKEDRDATLKFLKWISTSEEGTRALAEDMGFASPFKKAKSVNNHLTEIMTEYTEKGLKPITWKFSVTPNVDVWRSDLVDALAAYSAGKGKWDAVEKAFVDGWKRHYNASKD